MYVVSTLAERAKIVFIGTRSISVWWVGFECPMNINPAQRKAVPIRASRGLSFYGVARYFCLRSVSFLRMPYAIVSANTPAHRKMSIEPPSSSGTAERGFATRMLITRQKLKLSTPPASSTRTCTMLNRAIRPHNTTSSATAHLIELLLVVVGSNLMG